MKRAVIMADGKGSRWRSHMDIPKHLAVVKGEEIIARTVRLLNRENEDLEVIITSHDKRYEFPGSRRYEPLNNVYEIDRFTEELIVPDMCFLYGDTFYTEEAIKTIMTSETEDLLFFGNRKSIVAITVKDDRVFREHVDLVRNLYLKGAIEKCVGWQVYWSFTGQSFDGDVDLSRRFVELTDGTTDINTPEEYEEIEK